jgi:hypothetical protein
MMRKRAPTLNMLLSAMAPENIEKEAVETYVAMEKSEGKNVGNSV